MHASPNINIYLLVVLILKNFYLNHIAFHFKPSSKLNVDAVGIVMDPGHCRAKLVCKMKPPHLILSFF